MANNGTPSGQSRKRKAGQGGTDVPIKHPHANGSSEPSLAVRRKTAESRVANLIQTLDAATTPPQTLTLDDISHQPSTRPLRCFACDVWYYTNGYHSLYPPESGAGRAELVASDAEYQSSRPFNLFRWPDGLYVYCILCV
jgi:hypothetical protein